MEENETRFVYINSTTAKLFFGNNMNSINTSNKIVIITLIEKFKKDTNNVTD